MLIIDGPEMLEMGMEQRKIDSPADRAILAAFRPLPDRDQLRLLRRLVAATDWSRFRGSDAIDDGITALADDLAEAEGWGDAAGERYLRPDLSGHYGALRAARSLVDHYRACGDDVREARHDARALAIRNALLMELGRRSGLDRAALHDLIG
jgi:hypothetical protein